MTAFGSALPSYDTPPEAPNSFAMPRGVSHLAPLYLSLEESYLSQIIQLAISLRTKGLLSLERRDATPSCHPTIARVHAQQSPHPFPHPS